MSGGQRFCVRLSAIVAEIADVIEVGVADEARLERALRLELHPARERTGVDGDAVVEDEGARAVLWRFATVATDDLQIHRCVPRCLELLRHLDELEELVELAHVDHDERPVAWVVEDVQAVEPPEHVDDLRRLDAHLARELLDREAHADPIFRALAESSPRCVGARAAPELADRG